MPATPRNRQGLSSTLQTLSLSHPNSSKKAPSKNPTTAPITDSWEDDASSSTSDSDSDSPNHHHRSPGSNSRAPPPTPMSPNHPTTTAKWSDFPTSSSAFTPDGTPISPIASTASSGRPGSRKGQGGEFRPEKTTAVAGRLIAGALGVKTPGKSEEGRAYDRVTREKEVRRRAEEKEMARREEQERERGRREVWEG